MKNIFKSKLLIIIIVVFIMLLSFYFIREYMASKNIYVESYLNGKDYIMNPKKYGVNEYSIINMTDEKMANLYLNNYKNLLLTDLNKAYNNINNEYRQIKFPTIEQFTAFVENLDYSTMIVDRYSHSSCQHTDCYYIYDKSNNLYIFKLNSVMEYEVYLDDYTIEI